MEEADDSIRCAATEPSKAAAQNRPSSETIVDQQRLQVASFDASFVPSARPAVSRSIPFYRDRSYYLDGWLDSSIWKSAFIEAVATGCSVFVSGSITATLFSYKTNVLGAYIGISNTVLLALFIYASAPASGGHLNPMITFSSILVGICPLARGVLYMCGQTLGAAAVGGLLSAAWGRERSLSVEGGGCFVNFDHITTGQVYLNEFLGSFALLYLAFGVGLDPRQAVLFGPRLGPLLVGASLGLVSFSTSGLAPGYAGAAMNPARCLAYGIVRRSMADQWIWWFGPAAASVFNALVYHAVPPHHLELAREKSCKKLGADCAKGGPMQHSAV
ncbi:hypothetical protein JDV02_000532 [Purpureocillium takamizusanense]|uniref:Aquaporin-like protein n=1 Tax=Purpureocillium takamizusanense TaxID=2060973 RepID=A0A9Q8Q796_9HYPO|nr:uncharacterized protein JDV02_000532 [Purpureocillium takamizusanense]UNI13829.1 hypothetical protein JDV02_000532 [Purpureocillium takamizusanense]